MMDDVRKEPEGTLKIFASAPAAPAAPVAPTQAPAAPVAPAHEPEGTLKIFASAPAAPAAPVAPVQAPAAPVAPAPLPEGTLKIFASAPAAPAAPAAPVQSPAAPTPRPVQSTVKIFESAPSEKVQAAMNLRPTTYPDQLQHFSPADVKQTISQMCIVYNGQAYHFDRPVSLSIGRSAGNMMVIPDAHVSAQHAVIDCGSSAVTVRNVSTVREGRQNPVYINDRPLEGSSVLNSGDVLKLNCVPLTVTWTVRTSRAPAAPQPVPAAAPAAVPAATPAPMMQDAQVTVPILRQGESQQTLATVRLLVTWKLPNEQEQQRIICLTEQLPATIGRSEGDTVFLNDPYRSVSRSHLTLAMQGGAITLRNSSKGPDGSAGYNPVYLEGSRMNEPVMLTDCLGKKLELGLAGIVIRMAD